MTRDETGGEIPDETLVIRALLGDLTAFDALVARFCGAATWVARPILGSQAAAEDVVQEAFLLAFKALPQIQEPARFGPWLCAITRNQARRVAERENRSEPVEPTLLDRLLVAQSPALARHPVEAVLENERRRCVRAALAGMDAEYGTVLYLYYFDAWPVARIAGFLSLPITTVKWRLHHGRTLLRRRLAPSSEETFDERNESP